jgi:prolyl-tRNA synthetase
VLGPTHEEVVTDMAARNVQSYRDLPFTLYQIQTKMRDEPRPRGGLIRVREFTMKDAYSFDASEEGLDVIYKKMVQAYKNIYKRCGLPTILIEADSGAIGGKDSQEFMAVTEIGEDEIIICDSCELGANVEKAVSIKPKAECNPILDMEEVSTPGKETIEDVAIFLKVKPTQTLKAVFYIADGELIFVVIRGDLEVNEVKLKKVLHAADLRLATDAEVRAKGIVPGSASPVGILGVRVVADESVSSGSNFVAGANKQGRHLRNVNYPRDFKSEMVADISRARAGDACSTCGGTLRSVRGMEVGHVFKLGTSISEKLGASFVDESGTSHPIIMGCYGIGIGRLMAAVIELNHDDKGIMWPKSIAPYQVYLCPLYMDNAGVVKQVESLYNELSGMGIEVLYDDRTESPGVKFNDADLLGIPIRVTVSPRSLEKGSVEIKLRSEKKAELVGLGEAIAKVKALLEE